MDVSHSDVLNDVQYRNPGSKSHKIIFCSVLPAHKIILTKLCSAFLGYKCDELEW